ncbi:MAG: pyridoxamine 5'-phosphate oxidase family protein [Nitrospirae bacterium]|nr:pyridoxamine 5'-phosphate oxidase family protein [Nitrospirota bacterium]
MSDLKKRISDVAHDLQLINIATITEDNKPWVRYVMGKADGELVFRFCTHTGSRKVPQIRKNPNVHISLGVKDLETARHWLQVQGAAEISLDRKERHSFWFDELKNYFSGPDDPDYCIVIIRPARIEFGTMGNMSPEIWEPGTVRK